MLRRPRLANRLRRTSQGRPEGRSHVVSLGAEVTSSSLPLPLGPPGKDSAERSEREAAGSVGPSAAEILGVATQGVGEEVTMLKLIYKQVDLPLLWIAAEPLLTLFSRELKTIDARPGGAPFAAAWLNFVHRCVFGRRRSDLLLEERIGMGKSL
eukprot:Skav209904  [mRNA]  locus=scaffold2642:471025:472956:- [translate_table: standard]